MLWLCIYLYAMGLIAIVATSIVVAGDVPDNWSELFGFFLLCVIWPVSVPCLLCLAAMAWVFDWFAWKAITRR